MIKINNQYKIKLKVKLKGKIKEELLMKLENQYLLVEVSEDGAEITIRKMEQTLYGKVILSFGRDIHRFFSLM